MKASENCINIIKQCEGLVLKAYRCPAGIPTIGYGSTRYADGKAVSMDDLPTTEAEASILLAETLYKYEIAVDTLVKVPLNQNQFDALVDFAYNCGSGNLATSTLLTKINNKDYAAAALEFAKWNKGGGKVLAGLTKRRELERALFLA